MDVLAIVPVSQTPQPEAPERGKGGPPMQERLHFLG